MAKRGRAGTAMASFELLYLQTPFWIWLAAACLCAGASLATGTALLMAPAAAAAAVAALGVAGVRLGPFVEAVVFVVLALALAAGARLRGPRPERRPAAEPRTRPERPREPTRAPGPQELTGRLIGRIGRASSEFANGVGRVWIDGTEWAAELDAGEDGVAQGEPVRVVKVIGGVRLQVHPLAAG